MEILPPGPDTPDLPDPLPPDDPEPVPEPDPAPLTRPGEAPGVDGPVVDLAAAAPRGGARSQRLVRGARARHLAWTRDPDHRPAA